MAVRLEGILAATVTPFDSRLELDEEGLKEHVRFLAGVSGIGGIVVNAPVGEGATLNKDERVRCIRTVAAQVNRKLPIVAGIESLSTMEAVEMARQARTAGADALMICPPPIFAWNAAASPQFAMQYHRDIDREVNMPLVLFQYPPQSAYAYSHETLMSLVRGIENVVAVKLAHGGNIRRYEEDLAALRGVGRRISALPASAREFFQQFLTGADGALTGFANVSPQFCVDMWAASRKGDMAKMKKLHERFYPITSAIYSEPYVYLHTRYKEAAFLAGRIKDPSVRPPQLPLSQTERELLSEALKRSGLV